MANYGQQAERKRALACAVKAAQSAGDLMRHNARKPKRVCQATQHDLKLELDVRCQQVIERTLRSAFPGFAILGEEGVTGSPEAEQRWVVDPIDGTVNFAYGVPHASVSIALQSRLGHERQKGGHTGYESVLGAVYDPFCDELWTAILGQPARLNGRPIRVSERRKLEETIVSVGFAKERRTLAWMLPVFQRLVHRVRKIRIMGSAALGLAYVAGGRFDAYVEYGLRLWDVAAGGLILECAGGEFWHRPIPGKDAYEIVATNGLLRRQIQRLR